MGTDPTKQIAMDGTTGTIKAGDKVYHRWQQKAPLKPVIKLKSMAIRVQSRPANVAIDGTNGTIKAG